LAGEVASPPVRGPAYWYQSLTVESNGDRRTVDDVQPRRQQQRRPHPSGDEFNDDSVASSASLRALLLRRREPEVATAESFELRTDFRAQVEEEERCRSAFLETNAQTTSEY